jgi:hypothetical protein
VVFEDDCRKQRSFEAVRATMAGDAAKLRSVAASCSS